MTRSTRGLLASGLMAAAVAVMVVPGSRKERMSRAGRKLVKEAAGWLARQLQTV